MPSCSSLQSAGGARVLIRPSGTEPKVKLYAEVGGDLSVLTPTISCAALYQSPNWRSPASPRPGTM